MSLAPMIPGILSLAVFLTCPITMKWLMTICIVPSFMGLISPALLFFWLERYASISKCIKGYHQCCCYSGGVLFDWIVDTHNLYLSAVYGHITTIYRETVDIVSRFFYTKIVERR